MLKVGVGLEGCDGGVGGCEEVEEEGGEEEDVEGDGEGEGRVEEVTATAVRGFEGGALIFTVSFGVCTGLLGCEGGVLALGASFCT